MEKEPTRLIEFIQLILYIGSITFFIGATFQTFILYKRKTSFLISCMVILVSRILSIISSLIIWKYWFLTIDIMFLFVFLPALIPEVILNCLTIRIIKTKKTT